MNKNDLENLTAIRLREAQALFDADLYNGAYYLAGYTIECGLKACIAKLVRQYDFPDKELVNQSYTHDLKKLVRAAKLETYLEQETQSNPNLASNWTLVKDWNEAARYKHGISQSEAEELLQAINDHSDGVLSWVKKFW